MDNELTVTQTVLSMGRMPFPENTHDGKSAYAVDIVCTGWLNSCVVLIRSHSSSKDYIYIGKANFDECHPNSIHDLIGSILSEHGARVCKPSILTRIGLRGHKLKFHICLHTPVFRDTVQVGAVAIEGDRVRLEMLSIDVSTMDYEHLEKVTDSMRHRIFSKRPIDGPHGVVVIQPRQWYDTSSVVQCKSSSKVALVYI